jgi:hypothetical protein
MKFIQIVVATCFTTTLLFSCNGRQENKQNETAPVDNTRDNKSPAKTKAAVYYCPMHPEVTSDKPGICPKCQMDLVLKEDSVSN